MQSNHHVSRFAIGVNGQPGRPGVTTHADFTVCWRMGGICADLETTDGFDAVFAVFAIVDLCDCIDAPDLPVGHIGSTAGFDHDVVQLGFADLADGDAKVNNLRVEPAAVYASNGAVTGLAKMASDQNAGVVH